MTPQLRRWRSVIVVLALLLGLSVVGEGLAAPPEGKGKPGGGGSEADCLLYGGGWGQAQVVLDPGHGGSDPGAQNLEFGLTEMNLNLTVAEYAAEILQSYGYTVVLTRYDNETGMGNSERGEIANACGAEAFVSIHFNSSASPDPNYTQTFWGKRRKDEAFAQHMNAALWPALATDPYGGETNLGNNGTWQFATGSLLQADMQSTLVETVFLSNPDEAARLAEGARLYQIAEAIAWGVHTRLA